MLSARTLVAASLLATAAACSSQEATVTDQPTTTTTEPSVLADAIPVAHTPPGGYGDVMPPPVLGTCTEPLADGVTDLRGLWATASVEVGGAPAPDHPSLGLVQRIEQCGDRLVVTAGGVVHDMRCDGTEEHGVHDVAERDYTTEITVVATFEDGVHVLRPVGLPGIEVTRRLDGDQIVWDYPGFTARLDRLGPPDMTPPPA